MVNWVLCRIPHAPLLLKLQCTRRDPKLCRIFLSSLGGDEALHVPPGCCLRGHSWHHHMGLFHVLPQVTKQFNFFILFCSTFFSVHVQGVRKIQATAVGVDEQD